MWFFRKKVKEERSCTGARGEDIAAVYLKSHGYKIRARNIRPDGHEEIDIVCETHTMRVFVEVKTRTTSGDDPERYGTPAMAVTQEKRRHLFNAAYAYHRLHPTEKTVRMDVIEVRLPADGGTPDVHHIEDAFRS